MYIPLFAYHLVFSVITINALPVNRDSSVQVLNRRAGQGAANPGSTYSTLTGALDWGSRRTNPGTTQPPQQSPASTGLIATTGTAVQHPVAGSSQQVQQQLHSSTGHTAQATTPPSTTRGVPNPLPPPTDRQWNAEWIPLGSIVKNYKGNPMPLQAQRCPYCYFLRYVLPGSDDASNAVARNRHRQSSHVQKTGDKKYSRAAKHPSHPDRYTYVGKDSNKATSYQCKRCRTCMRLEDANTHSC